MAPYHNDDDNDDDGDGNGDGIASATADEGPAFIPLDSPFVTQLPPMVCPISWNMKMN